MAWRVVLPKGNSRARGGCARILTGRWSDSRARSQAYARLASYGEPVLFRPQ
jgi:hypothetical protein